MSDSQTRLSSEIDFGALLPGHRFDHFNCGDRGSNEWLRTSSQLIPRPPRNHLEVLTAGPLVLGFVSSSVRRLRRRRWLYLIDIGVDLECQGLDYGLLMLYLVEHRAADGQYGTEIEGLECSARTTAAVGLLTTAGFTQASASVGRRYLRRIEQPDRS